MLWFFALVLAAGVMVWVYYTNKSFHDRVTAVEAQLAELVRAARDLPKAPPPTKPGVKS